MMVVQCMKCHRLTIYPSKITRRQCGCGMGNLFLHKSDGSYYTGIKLKKVKNSKFVSDPKLTK